MTALLVATPLSALPKFGIVEYCHMMRDTNRFDKTYNPDCLEAEFAAANFLVEIEKRFPENTKVQCEDEVRRRGMPSFVLYMACLGKRDK